MATHRILRLEGPYLSAAVMKCMHPRWPLELRKNEFSQDGVVCRVYRTLNPGTHVWEVFELNWLFFGRVLERHHDLINQQMVKWHGTTWNIHPHDLLKSMATAFVKAKTCQDVEDDNLIYEIELPDPT